MGNVHSAAVTLLSASVFAGSLLLGGVAVAADDAAVKEGKQIAFDRSLGNCLACHMVDDGESPGDLGPPMVAMKARFPNRKDLYNRLWDASKLNPETRMPPFGKHMILTHEQIEKVIDYLYTL